MREWDGSCVKGKVSVLTLPSMQAYPSLPPGVVRLCMCGEDRERHWHPVYDGDRWWRLCMSWRKEVNGMKGTWRALENLSKL